MVLAGNEPLGSFSSGSPAKAELRRMRHKYEAVRFVFCTLALHTTMAEHKAETTMEDVEKVFEETSGLISRYGVLLLGFALDNQAVVPACMLYGKRWRSCWPELLPAAAKTCLEHSKHRWPRRRRRRTHQSE